MRFMTRNAFLPLLQKICQFACRSASVQFWRRSVAVKHTASVYRAPITVACWRDVTSIDRLWQWCLSLPIRTLVKVIVVRGSHTYANGASRRYQYCSRKISAYCASNVFSDQTKKCRNKTSRTNEETLWSPNVVSGSSSYSIKRQNFSLHPWNHRYTLPHYKARLSYRSSRRANRSRPHLAALLIVLTQTGHGHHHHRSTSSAFRRWNDREDGETWLY